MGLAALARRVRARRLAGRVRAGARRRAVRSPSRAARPTRCSPRGRCSACARRGATRPGRSPTCSRRRRRCARRPTSRSSRSPNRRSARHRRRCSPGCAPPRGRAARSARRVNSTRWAVLALGRSTPATTRWLLAHQARTGGLVVGRRRPARLERHCGGARGAARRGRARRAGDARGALPARFQNRDGGFELTNGRGSDAQSTAWAIQGLVAAGATPPRSAFAYLARLQARRRELPLLGAVRDDAGLGHVAGAGRARARSRSRSS